MTSSIGFIGTGNMGSILARAAVQGMPEAAYFFANHTPARAEALAAELGTGTVTTNRAIAASCTMIVLGVKPQVLPQVFEEIRGNLQVREDRFVLVSMAAGISCARIQELAGMSCPVIRIMPNTPCSVGAGVVQVCGKDVRQEELDEFCIGMKAAGMLDQVPEGFIDAACALSGCGPAFVSVFIDALADGAVACGLPRSKALAYAAQTVEGTARLVLESSKHPGVLKDEVTSPGGTAAQGLRALENHGFRAATLEAVIASYEKTVQMGRKKSILPGGELYLH